MSKKHRQHQKSLQRRGQIQKLPQPQAPQRRTLSKEERLALRLANALEATSKLNTRIAELEATCGALRAQLIRTSADEDSRARQDLFKEYGFEGEFTYNLEEGWLEPKAPQAPPQPPAQPPTPPAAEKDEEDQEDEGEEDDEGEEEAEDAAPPQDPPAPAEPPPTA